jgi:hypothetical protein
VSRNARSRRWKLRRLGWWTCRGCRAFLHPIDGCADDMPHHCDACWWALARTSLPRVPAVLVDSPIAPAYLATFGTALE